MKAKLHPQEHSRLDALRNYAVLDTPKESDFDEIVALAAALCETSAAQINFIDKDRQWSKAEVGVGVQTIPREMSICSHTLLEDGFVEIPDLLEDARTLDNPFCTGAPFVRFYAGIQLRMANGSPIGTLCVLDMQPRTLTSLQKRSLIVLASQIMAQLDLRATLANESILRSEIDHRVKNSLQSVGAFVALEKSAASGDETIDVLQNIQQQILMVSELHDHISRNSGEEKFDLSEYLGRLTEILKNITPKSIQIIGHFDAVKVNPKVGAIVGTILNELVTNAVKHSFQGREGILTINGISSSDDAYRIIVQDDAAAPQQTSQRKKREGLGRSIINASVRQLNGTIESAATSGGYRTSFEFDV